MGSPAEYVCTLDEASLKKARQELNEDPADRMNAVEAFRNLIKTRAPHIRCSMETSFLLRFLRVAKFSQLEALKRLERYLNMFNTMSDWIRDIDMSSKGIQAFMDSGYFVPLGHNNEGQMVNLFNLGAFDPKSKKICKKDMFVGIFGIMLYQNTTESNNVNGSKGFADLTDFQLKHQMWWTPEDMKKFAEVMNGAVPVRWKNLYYYNHGPIFQVVFNMFAPLMKKKIRDRLVLCGNNLEGIYDKIMPMRLLPTEYLPDDYTGPTNGSLKELIKRNKEEMSKPEVVARIKYETSDAFRLDESKRPKNDVPLQTFRKLNVD